MVAEKIFAESGDTDGVGGPFVLLHAREVGPHLAIWLAGSLSPNGYPKNLTSHCLRCGGTWHEGDEYWPLCRPATGPGE